MKIFKIILFLILLVLVIIQFFPMDLNKSEKVAREDFMMVHQVPVKIKRQLQVSCYDCHSNNTEYPWYSRVQPVAWYLEDHIQEGRQELNFNEWGSYSSRRQNSKLRSMISQIESGEMPLDSYLLLHEEARMDSVTIRMVTGYLENLKKD